MMFTLPWLVADTLSLVPKLKRGNERKGSSPEGVPASIEIEIEIEIVIEIGNSSEIDFDSDFDSDTDWGSPEAREQLRPAL
ncbi:hypothetical protein [Desulfonatronum lacustre]|uniref:hypothetical protein n=1 Tax=Desulfonatronum lacustre TaxID=66849 RepID=UPI00048C1C00|nr:hypothetical protein [Desulfonatronum lacustre]